MGLDSTGGWGSLSDLWKFDGTNWTWVGGAKTKNQTGIYGTRGVAAATNIPDSRMSTTSWIDSSGNLWIFGGSGCGSTYVAGQVVFNLNDLWKYQP